MSELSGIRESIIQLCNNFPNKYWRELEKTKGYPDEFIKVLSKEGFLSVLIPEKFELNWIVDFLDFLDIEYITFKSNKKIKVEDLIVTSYPAPSGNFHKTTLLNLRSNFLSNYIPKIALLSSPYPLDKYLASGHLFSVSHLGFCATGRCLLQYLFLDQLF